MNTALFLKYKFFQQYIFHVMCFLFSMLFKKPLCVLLRLKINLDEYNVYVMYLYIWLPSYSACIISSYFYQSNQKRRKTTATSTKLIRQILCMKPIL